MGPQNPDSTAVNVDLEPGHDERKPQSIEGSEDHIEKKALDDAPPAYQDDPFGDEEFAEVKYRTLSWWYVSPTTVVDPIAFLTLSQAMWNGCAIPSRTLSIIWLTEVSCASHGCRDGVFGYLVTAFCGRCPGNGPVCLTIARFCGLWS